MQEYIYYNKNGLDLPVDESILVSNSIDEVSSSQFLISNSNEIRSEVYANEIDFYINNSQDSIPDKIRNIKKLYDIAALKYENAKDFTKSLNIENKILLIANIEDARGVMSKVHADEFDMFHIDEKILKSISGKIGELNVVVDDNGKDVELKVDQIIWFDVKEEGLKQSGTFDPKKSSVDEVLLKIRANIKDFEYKKFTTYDKNICQYHERRDEVCGKCEDVCPTVAITKDDKNKHLNFSQVDCHGCGGCISVCPSGALDYAPSDRDSIYEIAKNYKDTHPLIIPNKMELDFNIELKENILPFKIEGEKFLHEQTLLTLLQMSGSQLIFFTDFLSKGTIDSINILNSIYQKKYAVDAIIIASNKDELEYAINNIEFVSDSYYNFNEAQMKKREIFSYRLQQLIGEDDLGVVQTGPNVHYSKVRVNEDKCTLCLSCVGACNVDALYADVKTNELKLNPSLCTSCGYCELSCAEDDCLSIQRDIIELNPSFFKFQVLAKDELFACIECGKEFATKRAIEKVANIMKPIFKDDEVKIKTLYACDKCKPKIMLENVVGVN